MFDIKNLINQKNPEIAYSIEVADLNNYAKDRTDFYPPQAQIILFPKSTAEVQQIVQLANEHQLSIVPSGGRTGLSGGAVATNREIVVSMDKMNRILSFNDIDQTVQVQAGVITEEIQNFAREKGLYYPVDFAARGSSQIGGNIATNAGGIRVIRYGMTRNWVKGLMVVTGSGEILNTNHGLTKNATGYDLRHLIIGSEGTLGIITEATIQLSKAPKHLHVLLLSVNEIKDAINILTIFQKKITLSAFEFFSHKALQYVIQATDEAFPFPEKSSYYVLLEFENVFGQTLEKVGNIVNILYENKLVHNDLIGIEQKEIRRIWTYRENISESIARYTPYKNDISVLTANIPSFIAEAKQLLTSQYPDFEVLWYGHMADGNIHINILKPENYTLENFQIKCEKVSALLFKLIKKYKGSISAEHGVGILKRKYLSYSRSEVEITLMKGIKKIFDPKGIMNPGKLLP